MERQANRTTDKDKILKLLEQTHASKNTKDNYNKNEFINQNRKAFDKFLIKIFIKNMKQRNMGTKVLNLQADEVFINPNYFHLNFIRAELEKNKSVVLLFEKDLVEKIQPNKIICNTTLLNFYFFYLQNNIRNKNLKDNKASARFKQYEYFMDFFKKTNNCYNAKYSKLYSNYSGNPVKNNDKIKKFSNDFLKSAKNFIFYNLYLIKNEKKLPLLKINERSFYFNNEAVEPNNVFISEVLEMKDKYPNSLKVFPYFKGSFVKFELTRGTWHSLNFESFALFQKFGKKLYFDKLKDDANTNIDNDGILIEFHDAKGYQTDKNEVDNAEKNWDRIIIQTDNITKFKNIFETEKLFLFKNNKRRMLSNGETVLKYYSKHLKNRIKNENQFLLEPFLIKYVNQMFLMGEKIKLDYLNYQGNPLVEKQIEDENEDDKEVNPTEPLNKRILLQKKIKQYWNYLEKDYEKMHHYFSKKDIVNSSDPNLNMKIDEPEVKLNKEVYCFENAFIDFSTNLETHENFKKYSLYLPKENSISELNHSVMDFDFRSALDEISIYNKLDRKFIRYYLIRYGLKNTKTLLRKSTQTTVLSNSFGITEAQIKFEIEHLDLKKPLDFILKRHNFIGLLDRRNSLELFNVLECLLINLNYSKVDLFVELYKINLMTRYLQGFVYNTQFLEQISLE